MTKITSSFAANASVIVLMPRNVTTPERREIVATILVKDLLQISQYLNRRGRGEVFINQK